MDEVNQQPSPSKPQHRFKPVGQQQGDSQGASPASYVMADGTKVMRLDDINKMLHSLEKLDQKALKYVVNLISNLFADFKLASTETLSESSKHVQQLRRVRGFCLFCRRYNFDRGFSFQVFSPHVIWGLG
jgi:hypothetical protein